MRVKEKTRRLNILISESLHDQLNEMTEKSNESKSDFVRQAIKKEFERRIEKQLEQAAAELAHLYETDEELIAITGLDGEEFF